MERPEERDVDPREAARARWRAARSFGALCELGARFVLGELAAFPGWGAAWPDVETDAIAPALARLNRAGLLTVASQPGWRGRREGRAAEQRAFVAGFARGDVAARLAALDGREVRVRAHPDGAGEEEPVTLEDGLPRVVVCAAARDEELALFADHLDAAALGELAAARYVVAWDPEWARADALWPALIAAAEGRGA